jgi:hypothetical protein
MVVHLAGWCTCPGSRVLAAACRHENSIIAASPEPMTLSEARMAARALSPGRLTHFYKGSWLLLSGNQCRLLRQ